MSPQAMYFWPKNGQNGQNKNFPRHNNAIWWFKAIVPSFSQSFRQIWWAVSKKITENLIFERKWPNFGPKKGPKMALFFCQNKNFHWLFLNNKLGLNKKIKKKPQPFRRKWPKTSPKPYNVTTSNVFLPQIWPKRPKQEFFQPQHCHLIIQSNSPQFLTKF